jgi:tripartite ATP-independent transporter DctM subunit
MEWWLVFLIVLGGTISLLMMGLPVGIAFLFADLIGTLVFMGGTEGVKLLILNLEEALTSFSLLTVPMFILMGDVMFRSKMAFRAIDTLDYWIGRVPGRLGLLSVVSGTIFAATSGSTVANTSLLGSILIPEMKRRGYSDQMSIGPVIGCGALAMLIPPSIVAVILATLMDISVGKLLIAGIVPGLVLASFYAIYIIGRCISNPRLAPPYDLPPVLLTKKLKDTVYYVLPLGIVIFLVVGIIFLGVATPSEAAAMGAIGAVILAAVYRQMSWKLLKECFTGTIKLTTAMFVIIVGSTAFSQILAFSGASGGMIESILKFNFHPIIFLIIMQLILVFLGCFMDNVSIAMISIPIFLPLTKALHIDPLWFGAMTLINLDMGNLTPPFGLQLFVMKGVMPETPMGVIIRSAFPFLLCEAATLISIMIFPQVALFLPGIMHGR